MGGSTSATKKKNEGRLYSIHFFFCSSSSVDVLVVTFLPTNNSSIQSNYTTTATSTSDFWLLFVDSTPLLPLPSSQEEYSPSPFCLEDLGSPSPLIAQDLGSTSPVVFASRSGITSWNPDPISSFLQQHSESSTNKQKVLRLRWNKPTPRVLQKRMCAEDW